MPENDLLKARQSTHGDFTEQAQFIWATTQAMEKTQNWPTLSPTMREAVHMILHKIGRVLVGDPIHADHWADIAGYATLIVERLPGGKSPVDNGDEFEGMLEQAARVWKTNTMVAAHHLGKLIKNYPPPAVPGFPDDVEESGEEPPAHKGDF